MANIIAKTIAEKIKGIMTQRRKSVNTTGIDRLSSVNSSDIFVMYTCVNCGKQNIVLLGKTMLDPIEAYENCEWVCPHCGFVHSKENDLPESWEQTWKPDFLLSDSEQCQAFWKAFFRACTLNPEVYWKQCNVCGRILPYAAFDRHVGWGAIEKQLECKSCKAAINATLNPKRTTEQLRESSLRRRMGDLFNPLEPEKIDREDLFKRFGGKCFLTNTPLDINDTQSWHIDHILPSKYFYPLTKENACLLSAQANGNKRDKWPSKFYNHKQLVELSKITGAPLDLLLSEEPIINKNIDVNKAFERWTDVRDKSDLAKRLKEFKKVIIDNNLVEFLSENNRKALGLG